MRIALQPAYILHSRAYRETSALLDVFTIEYGRVSLVAKGVRTQQSKIRSLLQPFVPLLISFQGKSELMTMTTVEPNGIPLWLKGDCLLSGFYLNELLCRLLQKSDPHPVLYAMYEQTLLELRGNVLAQKTLRLFEKKLLDELGYGLPLQEDFSTGNALQPDAYYQYVPEQGFKQCEEGAALFIGKHLIALHHEQLQEEDVLRDAKRLMRMVLRPLLGEMPLNSRKLFIEVTQ